jgi:sporulation protein YlmC with PRC-barrel domain
MHSPAPDQPADRPAGQPGQHGPIYTGRTVIDEHGEQLGEIADVVFDQELGRPEYLVVNPGVFRKAHYVPVDGTYETFDGDIVVPWDRHWFKLAPTATRDHVLTNEERHELETHYASH